MAGSSSAPRDRAWIGEERAERAAQFVDQVGQEPFAGLLQALQLLSERVEGPQEQPHLLGPLFGKRFQGFPASHRRDGQGGPPQGTLQVQGQEPTHARTDDQPSGEHPDDQAARPGETLIDAGEWVGKANHPDDARADAHRDQHLSGADAPLGPVVHAHR